MNIDANTFTRYDALRAEGVALDGVDQALADARKRLSLDRQALTSTENKLAVARERIGHYEKKIDKYEHDWVHHVMSVLPGANPQQRVERQQDKRTSWQDEERRLVPKEEALQEQRLADQQAVKRLNTASQRKRAVDSESSAIFNSVIDALATPQLAALRQQCVEWRKATEFEASNGSALNTVAQLCDRAQSLYARALHSLSGAMQSNRSAQFANTVDIFTPGPGFGLEMYETFGQINRDQLMRTAAASVQEAAHCLTEAMKSIPAAAFARYPALCAGLGEVHLPHVELTGGGELMLEVFGGDFGDMIANSSAAGKIHRSLGSIDGCLRIASTQAQRVHALCDAVNRDYAKATAALQQTDAEVTRESDRIWSEARARVLCGSLPMAVPIADAVSACYATGLPMAVPIGGQGAPSAVAGIPVLTATAVSHVHSSSSAPRVSVQQRSVQRGGSQEVIVAPYGGSYSVRRP